MPIYNGTPVSSKTNSGLFPNQRKHVPMPYNSKRSGIPNIGLLNILTYLGEMALLMVPGVGEAAMIQIGIGLAGAATRLGLAVGNHQVNAISEAIDFSSAFLPGINEGILSLKLGKAAASETTQKFLQEMIKNNKNDFEANGLKLENKVQEEMVDYGKKKLRYKSVTNAQHIKAKAKIVQMHAKEYVKNIRYYEKQLRAAEDMGDVIAKNYYKEALRFTRKFNPLKNRTRFERLYANGRGVPKESESEWKEFRAFRATQNKYGKGQWALTRRRMNVLNNSTKPTMFDDPLTELSHDWSKGIVLPWKNIVNHKENAFDNFFKGLLKSGDYPQLNKLANRSLKEMQDELEAAQRETEQRYSRRIYESYMKRESKLGKFKPFKISKTLENQTRKQLENEKAMVWDATIIDNIAKKLADIKPSFKTNKGYIFKAINKDLDRLSEDKSDVIEKYLLISTKQKERQLSRLVYKRLLTELFQSVKDPDEKETLRALFRAMGKLSHHKLSEVFDKSVATLSQQTLESQSERLASAFQSGTDYFYKANFYEKLSKKYHFGNSTKFRYFKVGKYGKMGRLRNMINPMTLARAIPDSIYQTIKNYLDHKAGRAFKAQADWLSHELMTTEEKAALLTADEKSAEKLLADDAKAKKLFVKNGGILVPENRYLIGFKIIPSPYETEEEHVVMFMFNRINTMSKSSTSKNKNGKHSVIGTATDEDIVQLTEIGVSYFWAVGKQRGWYINRGGRQFKTLLETAVDSSMSLYLGFAPTNDIRQIVTLVSSTEYESIRWATGKNEHNLIPKMWTTSFRTALNRMSRLVARYPIPKVSALFSGRIVSNSFDRGFVGKEFQRYTSMMLALSIRTSTSTGKLQVGLPSMTKFTHRLEKTLLKTTTRQGFTRRREVATDRIHYTTDIRGRIVVKKKHNVYYGSQIRKMKSATRRARYLGRVKGIFYSRGLKGGLHVGQFKW